MSEAQSTTALIDSNDSTPLLTNKSHFSVFAEKDEQNGTVKDRMSNFYLDRFTLALFAFLLSLVDFFAPIPGLGYLLGYGIKSITTMATAYRSYLNILELQLADNVNMNLWQKLILNMLLATSGMMEFLGTVILLGVTVAFIVATLSILPFIAAAGYTGKFFFKSGLAIQQTIRYFRAKNPERKAECLGRLRKYWLSAAASLAVATLAFCVGVGGIFTAGASNLAFTSAIVFISGLNAWYSTVPQPGNVALEPNATRKATDMEGNFEPNTSEGKFFYKDIIATMKSIQTYEEQKHFLILLIQKKIRSLQNDINEGMVWNKTKHENKMAILTWLKSWIQLDTDEARMNYKLTVNGKPPQSIANMAELMDFLNKTNPVKKNVFASLFEGTGETEGLLRACAIYLDHKKFVDIKTGLVMYPELPKKAKQEENKKQAYSAPLWSFLGTWVFKPVGKLLWPSAYKKVPKEELLLKKNDPDDHFVTSNSISSLTTVVDGSAFEEEGVIVRPSSSDSLRTYQGGYSPNFAVESLRTTRVNTPSVESKEPLSGYVLSGFSDFWERQIEATDAANTSPNAKCSLPYTKQ